MIFDMDKLDVLLPEIKDLIFSFMSVSTLKATTREYFRKYVVERSIGVGVGNIDTYFRNIIRTDSAYILDVMLGCSPHIGGRRILYKKRKMTFAEYINALTIHYTASKCRKYVLDGGLV